MLPTHNSLNSNLFYTTKLNRQYLSFEQADAFH